MPSPSPGRRVPVAPTGWRGDLEGPRRRDVTGTAPQGDVRGPRLPEAFLFPGNRRCESESGRAAELPGPSPGATHSGFLSGLPRGPLCSPSAAERPGLPLAECCGDECLAGSGRETRSPASGSARSRSRDGARGDPLSAALSVRDQQRYGIRAIVRSRRRNRKRSSGLGASKEMCRGGNGIERPG